MSKSNGNSENVHIDEDEILDDGNETTWQEEFKMAGDQVGAFVKSMMEEASVRRIIVKNSNGKTLLDIPLAVGALGLLPPVLSISLLAFGLAVVTNCSVIVERVEEAETDTAAE